MKRFLAKLLSSLALCWLVSEVLTVSLAPLPQSTVWWYSVALGLGLLIYLCVMSLLEPRVAPFGQLVLLRSRHHPTLRGYMGAAYDYLQHMQTFLSEPEVIFAVALRHPSGIIFAAEQPGRHSHVIVLMSEQGRAGNVNTRDQGFLTSWGRYVDRIEGLAIAQAANQVIRKTSPEHKLFSEDLWEGPLLSQRRLYEKARELVAMAQSNCAIVTIEAAADSPEPAQACDLTIWVRDAQRLQPEMVREGNQPHP